MVAKTTAPVNQVFGAMEKSNRGEYYAAVDLGSNSFHMVVVHVSNGSVQIVNKIKQKVRLAAGLDGDSILDLDAMQRGWACLETFAERLQDIPKSNVKVVATATLRLAVNAAKFIDKAEFILGHKLSVVSGEEEAKQIYLGVAYTSANQGNMLVVDIGGASTEIIIGNDMHPIHLCSVNMGCVTLMEKFFANGKITQAGFDQAKAFATSLLQDKKDAFLCFDWHHCLGASGTPQAINEILVSRGICDSIRLDYLMTLEQECIKCGHVDNLDLDGLAESRKAIFPSGLAILTVLFEQLAMQTMNISGGALREGLIYGMLDSVSENDRQQQTLNILSSRFHIDKKHAKTVKHAAIDLCRQMCAQGQVCHLDSESILSAAALLHEIGLHIEYKRYHQHGAYLLQFIEMPGFTRLQRAAIRELVGMHRMDINPDAFDAFHDNVRDNLLGMLRILRISAVLCVRRHDTQLPEMELKLKDNDWTLVFPNGWLKSHPLLNAELTNEVWLQHKVGWPLKLVG